MKTDLQQIVALTLRWGVSIACLLVTIGGIYYLYHSGGQPLPDYAHFSYAEASRHTDYTTLEGIFTGLSVLNEHSCIQLGVLVLVLTPIVRVVLSLFDFIVQRDWLYALITAIVLAVIVSNSLEGF